MLFRSEDIPAADNESGAKNYVGKFAIGKENQAVKKYFLKKFMADNNDNVV